MDSQEFYRTVSELLQQGRRFCIATVVKTVGHTSGKVGSKAIILDDGSTLLGWVGGGCVESTVLHEGLKSLEDGRSRTILLEMEDELRGTGVPCGGTMEVYIEPVLPKRKLVLVGHGAIVENMARMAKLLDMSVVVADPENMLRDRSVADVVVTDPDLKGVEIDRSTAVVVATMHKQDHKFLKIALDGGAWYIGLIASEKRAGIVLETLSKMGVAGEELARIRTPAGIDIGGETPAEIALSILAEIVALARGGSGGYLRETKKMREELADVLSDSIGGAERVNPVC
ncbi:putative xanthine dehydrogenase subunit A [archaeon HR01]|nr:putative xanthine dehydrogenase subunit A [archaeon HR01]